MEKIKKIEIKQKLNEHKLWLNGEASSGKQADFSGLMIKIANFREAQLSKANFSDSILKIVEFVKADMQNANFQNTELIKVDFHDANMNGVNFKGTKFRKVHINEEDFNKMQDELTEDQKRGIITSYKKFMRKMIFKKKIQ
ncbi:pentapeptide repeat-containing protein [Promethearchaeum syntrophicum]|uniref:Pentapeptide repeat-containing protein n=1 Tax=Promethearchaeum syntrophicum TaxID=2594042 RepID=A0A5B9DA00_9ARCH|nr:pentapeptide repeat-containing protein [Candidatus Prometheoarchaeum syntrophicum]QEE15923.1 Pentapeptide repeats (8 copies) [Candidatus Prometheoarchaeum syntrophicum]